MVQRDVTFNIQIKNLTANNSKQTLDNTMREDEKEDNSKHPLIKVVWVVLAITVLVGIIGIVFTAMGLID